MLMVTQFLLGVLSSDRRRAHLLSLLVGGIWEQDVAKDSCRQGVLKSGVDQGLPVWALLLQLSLGIWSRGRCLLVWANLMLSWGIQ